MPETDGRRLSFDSAKTVLVPVRLYEKGTEEEYLRFNGMELHADEVAVASAPQDGIVAIMGVPARVWDIHKDECERGEVAVTSPLLIVAMGQGWGHVRGVNIFLTAGNVYLAVWERGLRMAEVLPDTSVDSILYYMQVVGRRFNLRKFDIEVSGEKAGLVADSLRRYYKKVRAVVLSEGK